VTCACIYSVSMSQNLEECSFGPLAHFAIAEGPAAHALLNSVNVVSGGIPEQPFPLSPTISRVFSKNPPDLVAKTAKSVSAARLLPWDVQQAPLFPLRLFCLVFSCFATRVFNAPNFSVLDACWWFFGYAQLRFNRQRSGRT